MTAPAPTRKEDPSSQPQGTEEAANLIQKLYRGHSTRRALDKHEANENTRATYSSLMRTTEAQIGQAERKDGGWNREEVSLTPPGERAQVGSAAQGLKPSLSESRPKQERINEVLKLLDRALEGSGKESSQASIGHAREQKVEDDSKRESYGTMPSPHPQDLQSEQEGKRKDLYDLTDSDDEFEAGESGGISMIASSSHADPSLFNSPPAHVPEEFTPTPAQSHLIDKDAEVELKRYRARANLKKSEKPLDIAKTEVQLDQHGGILEGSKDALDISSPSSLSLHATVDKFPMQGGASHEVLKTEEAQSAVVKSLVLHSLSAPKPASTSEGTSTSLEVGPSEVEKTSATTETSPNEAAPREAQVEDDLAYVPRKSTGRPVVMKKLDLQGEVLNIAAAEIQRVFRGHSSRKSSVELEEHMVAELSMEEKSGIDTLPSPAAHA